MSFIERQPDKRMYVSNGVFHITPVIQVNKFDPHNYNVNELIELCETAILQYTECKKANIPSEYLGGCKDGLNKMGKALGYYALHNEQARKLKADIESLLNITSQQQQHQSNLSNVMQKVVANSMPSNHSSVPNMPEHHKKLYEKLLLPRD